MNMSRSRSIDKIPSALRDTSPPRIPKGILIPSQRIITSALEDPKPGELTLTSAAHYEMIKHFQDTDNRERQSVFDDMKYNEKGNLRDGYD